VIRRPALVLGLLTALNLLNYLDRFVLSAVLPKVQDDLHLSNFVGGSLATVFLIGYFATSPLFGALADRAKVGERQRLIAAGIGVWSIATVATGLVHGTVALFAARAFVGVGEASYATIAPTFIDDLAPPRRRSAWMSYFSAAVPVGAALGYIVGGGVEAATNSWRAAFFVAGGPGIALALFCLFIAEPPRRAQPARPDVLASLGSLARLPLFVRAVIGFCAYTFAIGGFAYWAPKYLAARYGMEAGHAAKAFGEVTVAAGLVGTLLGGWLGDRMTRARQRRAEDARGGTPDASDVDLAASRGNLDLCAVSAALGAPLAAAAILATTPAGFFAWAFPCEVALFLSGGPINVVLMRSVPPDLRASAMAVCIFAVHLLGDLWSPPLIGFVADRAPMQWAMLGVPIAYAAGAIVWWSGPRTSARLT
jgi:MFS transporter, Spinster family, sphingosine-1-phosphate transporter